MSRALECLLVGDCVTQPLGRLASRLEDFSVTTRHAGIGQFQQVLLADDQPDVMIVHTTPAHFFDGATPDEAEARMEAHCAMLAQRLIRGGTLVLANTLEAAPWHPVGQQRLALARLAGQYTARLADLAAQHPMLSVVDVAQVLARIGLNQCLRDQSRLVMRMPYTKAALDALCDAYAQAILERHLPRRKVIVLDADNTLWGGIVGEDGVDGVAIDREFPGAVHWEFQQQLKLLHASGILLVLASKNDEADVRAVFDQRRMPLAWADFVAHRVNWEPKGANILAMAEELSLGTDSFVFIDDNPFEIEQVRGLVPGIACHQFDARRADAALALLPGLARLHCWSVTREDLTKSHQYQVEAERRALKQTFGSLDDYLRSLEIRVEAGLNRAAHVRRLAQLTNKTNQFNLTTRRYSETDLLAVMATGQVFDFRVIDRFGDMGLVGVAIVRDGALDSFLMSCRVLGRRIESTILRHVVDRAANPELLARFIPTARNALAARFLAENGFELVQSTATESLYRLGAGPQASPDILLMEIA